MQANIFKVQFDEDAIGGKKIPQEVKDKYLNAVKNDWNYPSVTSFFNMIADGVVNHNLIILKIDAPIIDRLVNAIQGKNYPCIEDWFKEQIRKELSNG